jgi:hypothetical protein
MRNFLFRAGIAIGLSLAAAACGGGGDSCNFVGSSANEPRCQERETKKGDPLAQFKFDCDAAGGAYGGSCPAGQVAGCRIRDNDTETITDWYYPPMTREDVRAACEGKGTYVDAD